MAVNLCVQRCGVDLMVAACDDDDPVNVWPTDSNFPGDVAVSFADIADSERVAATVAI